LTVSSSWLDQQEAEGMRLLDIQDLLLIPVKQEGSFSSTFSQKKSAVTCIMTLT